MIKALWTLVAALPEIIKLLQLLQEKIDEAETKRKVKDDIKAIHQAFLLDDPKQLDVVFNSK